MKRLILISLILLLNLSIKGQTNVYHPFPDSGGVWKEELQDSGQGTWYFFQYKMYGDSTIGAYQGKKLYKQGFEYYSQNYFNTFVGILHQDTSNKKVYLTDPYQGTYLIFDFNLQVGDSLVPDSGFFLLANANSSSPRPYVTAIDSILIYNGEYRKLFHLSYQPMFSSCNDISVIEGIGSTKGLLEPFCLFEVGSYLVCYKQNDELYYIRDTGFTNMSACNTIINSTDENVAQNNFISIYPNPNNGTFSITFSSFFPLDNNIIELFDLLGRNVFSKRIIENDETIETKILVKGIYILKLSSSFGKYYKLLIID